MCNFEVFGIKIENEDYLVDPKRVNEHNMLN